LTTDETFDYFIANAVITEVLAVVKSGKEATVYRCAAHPASGADSVAVKVYKDIERRSFRNMEDYLDGRIGHTVRKRRDILHMLSSSATMQEYWVEAEYGALVALRAAGLPVPRPLGRCPSAVAMEFVGDDDEGAPRLRDSRLDDAVARDVLEALLDAVERMLAMDTIHGDLSPYNVLMDGDRPVIIDFPQVVDARYNSKAAEMLERDLVNVCGYFKRHGLVDENEAAAIARTLWARYEVNELYSMADRPREAVGFDREYRL